MYGFSRIQTHQILTKEESGERWVEGIVSAQILDKQGEITIRDELMKALKDMLTKGKSMTDTHSNRIVGEWESFEPITIMGTDGAEIAAIRGKGKIFNGGKLYDDVWQKVKSGVYRGFSFGGATKSDRIPARMKDGRTAYLLKDLESWEVSICQSPAVPLALMMKFNTLAKSYSEEELGKMSLIQRDDDSMGVQCEGNICYVNAAIGHLDPGIKEIAPISKSGTLNKESEPKYIKKMSDIIKEDKDEKDSKESKDEEKDKSYERALSQTLRVVDKFAASVEERDKAVDERLTSIETGLANIGKYLEAPKPGSYHSQNEQVPLKNTYIDEENVGEPKNPPRDTVHVEEKAKAEEVVSTPSTPTQTTMDGSLASTLATITPNPIIAKCRERGNDLKHVAKVRGMVNSGAFGGRLDADPYTRHYPLSGGAYG